MNKKQKNNEFDIPDFMRKMPEKPVHTSPAEENDSQTARQPAKKKKNAAGAGRSKSGQRSKRPAAHKTTGHKPGARRITHQKTNARRPAGPKSGSSRTSADRKRRRKQQQISLYIHLGFVALILLIAIVGIVKLIRWNRGKESEYDPNEVTTEFDTESEDYPLSLDAATAAMQKDDGVTSILLLGNGSLAREKGKEDSIGAQLEKLTGGKVYDASLNHTYLSVKNAVYEESYPADVFSLYWLSQCITSGDYTLLEDNARTWDGDESVQETVEMLKNLDMSAIDVLVIMYDSHDYEDKRMLASPYDNELPVTCCGCLLQSIYLFKQAYPHIRIIVSSPYFNYIEDDNDELQPGSTYDMGQGTLADYMIAYKNIAVEAEVSFIDHYFGTINEDNYAQYLQDDKERLNSDGRYAIAQRIASFIGA